MTSNMPNSHQFTICLLSLPKFTHPKFSAAFSTDCAGRTSAQSGSVARGCLAAGTGCDGDLRRSQAKCDPCLAN